MITGVMQMPLLRRLIFIGVFLITCLLLVSSASAGPGIQAYMGDTIPLRGYSPSNPQVYLFLTGPNLPVNGVALNDITKPSDQGGFTVVDVNGEDDSWSYNWATSEVNGRLDEGTYTVWVVNGPNDRSHLQNAEYGTISVTLGTPSISLTSETTQAIPGSLVISSQPDNASVVVNGQYRGRTPLTLDNLDPGTYTVNLSKFGYFPTTATTNLQSGESQEITATLPPTLGSLFINTTPPGARVLVDGRDNGISPATSHRPHAGQPQPHHHQRRIHPVRTAGRDHCRNHPSGHGNPFTVIPHSFIPVENAGDDRGQHPGTGCRGRDLLLPSVATRVTGIHSRRAVPNGSDDAGTVETGIYISQQATG